MVGAVESEIEYYLADLLRAADSDGNGEISKEEFVAYLLADEDLDASGDFAFEERRLEVEEQLAMQLMDPSKTESTAEALPSAVEVKQQAVTVIQSYARRMLLRQVRVRCRNELEESAANLIQASWAGALNRKFCARQHSEKTAAALTIQKEHRHKAVAAATAKPTLTPGKPPRELSQPPALTAPTLQSGKSVAVARSNTPPRFSPLATAKCTAAEAEIVPASSPRARALGKNWQVQFRCYNRIRYQCSTLPCGCHVFTLRVCRGTTRTRRICLSVETFRRGGPTMSP